MIKLFLSLIPFDSKPIKELFHRTLENSLLHLKSPENHMHKLSQDYTKLNSRNMLQLLRSVFLESKSYAKWKNPRKTHLIDFRHCHPPVRQTSWLSKGGNSEWVMPWRHAVQEKCIKNISRGLRQMASIKILKSIPLRFSLCPPMQWNIIQKAPPYNR